MAYDKVNPPYFPCNYITYLVINTNLFTVFVYINYGSDAYRPQCLTILGKFVGFVNVCKFGVNLFVFFFCLFLA